MNMSLVVKSMGYWWGISLLAIFSIFNFGFLMPFLISHKSYELCLAGIAYGIIFAIPFAIFTIIVCINYLKNMGEKNE